MADRIWSEQRGDGPLVAAAIHAGHEVREEVAARLRLDDAQRLREEDPFTDRWTVVAPTRVVGLRSRFEVDLNRPREKAVYRSPADAWGLEVWAHPPDDGVLDRSLAEYDAFYRGMADLLTAIEHRHGHFVVLDLHSYNHRRGGPEAPPDDESANPQVNVGTGTMDRAQWAPLVDRFIADLRAYHFPQGGLDVRENVRFRGGHFPRWVHQTFPGSGCALAIELRKFFMDEWTGRADGSLLATITEALRSAVPGLLQELARL
jgi:N-formylglutamate amidohydrolase